MKRKLITISRRNARDEEEPDSSDSGEIVQKRSRHECNDQDGPEQSNSDNNQENPEQSNSDNNQESPEQLNSDNNQESSCPSSDEEEGSSTNEDSFFNNDSNTNDLMNNSLYDGYQSFINSFQFYSDEESCDSDSQVTLNCIKSESSLKIIQKAKEQNKLDDESFTEDHVRLLTLSNNIRVIGFYLENLEFVFMDHPSSVPIIGNLTVTLIAGKASIQGYNLQINTPVTVFSQKQTGFLSVTSHYCDEEQVCSIPDNVRSALSHNLKNVSSSTIRDFMKKYMKYSSTVFLLQNKGLPPEFQFLELYSPFATSFEKRDINTKTKYVAYLEDENVLKFGPEYEEIFSTIHKHLLKINKRKPDQSKKLLENLSSDEDDLENGSKKITGFHVLISGPKKSGKSNMLRYLVNCFLNKYPEVYYLDTDSGQTEFTPPGAISLIKVTEPVFGPPYSHLRKPLKSIYTGSITPESSPPMHMKSVTRMISYFNINFPDSILVVNTMGWLTGTGDIIYQHIKKTLASPVEIHLEPTLTPLNISVEGNILNCTVGFERDAASSMKRGENRPVDLRDWTVLTYFGQLQQHFLRPQTINAFRPLCVCWDDMAVYNFNKRLMYNRYYEALICSVVALCNVRESYILTPNNPDYPVTLEDEPDNECLGYGFVRAVDEENHLLYIVTPLSQSTLNSSVNAILSGNILVPRSVIYEQNIYDVPLYYTDKSAEGGTELRKAIRKRSRGHSSNNRSFYSH